MEHFLKRENDLSLYLVDIIVKSVLNLKVGLGFL